MIYEKDIKKTYQIKNLQFGNLRKKKTEFRQVL